MKTFFAKCLSLTAVLTVFGLTTFNANAVKEPIDGSGQDRKWYSEYQDCWPDQGNCMYTVVVGG